MNVRCSHCDTLYRIDPARIPAGGVSARCARCGQTFRIEPVAEPVAASAAAGPHAPAPAAATPAVPASAPVAEKPAAPARAPAAASPSGAGTAPAGPGGGLRPPVFGPQDPEVRAQRLARALVSDIVAYHQDRWEKSLEAGTLREDFREEILKSWEEYVLQVGSERAHGTSYFRDALNEILARGRQVF